MLFQLFHCAFSQIPFLLFYFLYIRKKFRIVPFSNNSEPHFLCRISIPALKCELPIKLTLIKFLLKYATTGLKQEHVETRVNISGSSHKKVQIINIIWTTCQRKPFSFSPSSGLLYASIHKFFLKFTFILPHYSQNYNISPFFIFFT